MLLPLRRQPTVSPNEPAHALVPHSAATSAALKAKIRATRVLVSFSAPLGSARLIMAIHSRQHPPPPPQHRPPPPPHPTTHPPARPPRAPSVSGFLEDVFSGNTGVEKDAPFRQQRGGPFCGRAANYLPGVGFSWFSSVASCQTDRSLQEIISVYGSREGS